MSNYNSTESVKFPFQSYRNKEVLRVIQYSKDKLPYIRPWIKSLGFNVEIEDDTMIRIGTSFNNHKILCAKDQYLCVNDRGLFVLTQEELDNKYIKEDNNE